MMQEVESEWKTVIRNLGLNGGELIATSAHDPFRRVYRFGDVVHKISLTGKEISGKRRANTLKQEYEILKSCTGIAGVQNTVGYKSIDDLNILLNSYIDGETLEKNDPGLILFAYINLQLLIVVVRLAFRGISHNDLLESNILIGKGYKVTLIDFDQATRDSPSIALLRSLFGIEYDGDQVIVYGSLLKLMKNYAINNCPGWLKKIVRIPYRMTRSIYRFYRARKENSLPLVDIGADIRIHKLRAAWEIAQKSNASSPGKNRAYYSLVYEGYKFPGERPWDERWHVFKSITDYTGKTVLELGCNMGLLSCYLVREAKASKSLAVDMDPKILRAAQLVAEAMDVNVVFKQINFDSKEDWELSLVNFSPDIVFALNVLNWIKDKEKFLLFLGNFKELVYEGHDSFEVESNRLRSAGFTSIDKVAITERGRDIIYCRRLDEVTTQ